MFWAPEPFSRKVFLGRSPRVDEGYPPPERRGHRLTTEELRDMHASKPLPEPPRRNPPYSRPSRQDAFISVPTSAPPRPDHDVSLRRETFGVSSGIVTLSEKFFLLSNPRSSNSTSKLRVKRCFSMHQVRGSIAKAMQKQSQAARTSLSRSSPTQANPLAPRPQWMRDEQPDCSDEAADAIWRSGTQRLFGEAQHLFSPPDA